MSVLLLHPFYAPIRGITLPNPKFGNGETLNVQTNIRHSRNGEVYAFRRVPHYQTLKMDFEYIKQSSKNDVKAFLVISAAEEIKLVDHLGQTWRGIIITPLSELQAYAKNDCGDLFSLSFEFEGFRAYNDGSKMTTSGVAI